MGTKLNFNGFISFTPNLQTINQLKYFSTSAQQQNVQFLLEKHYFPSQWYHATLNLDKYTAFVSTFTDGESKASYGDDRWGEL